MLLGFGDRKLRFQWHNGHDEHVDQETIHANVSLKKHTKFQIQPNIQANMGNGV